MTATTAADAEEARRLRDAMTDKLVRLGSVTSPQIEAAFPTVPRHAFARPGTPLEECYHGDIVRNTKDADGTSENQELVIPDVRAAPGCHASDEEERMGDPRVEYVWHDGPVPAGLPVTQVYGWLLCPISGRVLIQEQDDGTFSFIGVRVGSALA